MSLSAKQDALIEDLNFLPDPQERLAEIVRRGTRHSLPDALKTPDRRIPGCVSGVWVEKSIDPISSLPAFLCDADSPMVKGLAALLCDLYSHADPTEITTEEPRVWEACQLHNMLSPTRLNGLRALRERIVQLAQS
jgi:cysteine desulfuration protein SufE